MSDTIGFALVGCGMIARFHARALMEIPEARVTALVSRTAANAQALLDDVGLPPCPIHAALDTALQSPEVQAVIICTPSGLHADAAVAAAQAGKHVVVEKPLEISPKGCDRIINACTEADVKLATIFPSRFADSSVVLKQAVDAGRFGRLTLAETTCKWWRSQAYYDEGGWKGTLALDGGGALMNQAIHCVDMLLWMMGEATHVCGFTGMLAHERIEVEDTAVGIVRFASGALGVIQAATSVQPGYPKLIALHGDKGSAVIEQDDVLKWDFNPATPVDDDVKARFATKSGASGGAADPKAIDHEGHRRQLADFIQAIRENRPPAVDGAEGRRSVALIHALYESARSGRCMPIV